MASKSIVPFTNNSIPFMCSLIKYFESEDSIYLLLDYHPLGCLYSHLDAFFDRPEAFLEDALANKLLSNRISSTDDLATKKEHISSSSNNNNNQQRQSSVPLSNSVDANHRQIIHPRRRFSSYALLNRNRSFTCLHSLSIQSATTSVSSNIKRRTVSSAISDWVVPPSPGIKLAEIELKNMALKDDDVLMTNSSSSSNNRSHSTSSLSSSASFTSCTTTTANDETKQKAEINSHKLSPVKLINNNLNNSVKRSQIRDWLAQLFCSLKALHNMGVVCKDLGPRNLLLSSKGQLVLTYMSKWNLIDERVSRELAQDFYIAPGKKKQ